MKDYKTENITASKFQKFISSNTICVLSAYARPGLGFNKVLRSKLENEFADSITTGEMDISKMNYRSKVIQDFIKNSMSQIGLTAIDSILPGYYLFKDGILRAYHPATIDPSKIDTRVHGIAALFGALAGVIVGVVEKNVTKGFDVFLEATEAPVSLNVFQFFIEILGAKGKSYSQQRQQFVYNEELNNAYNLLKVPPTATDGEITKAWKKLQRENHPDFHPTDVEARTKFCAELNNAYELIRKSRSAKTYQMDSNPN